MSDTSDIDYDTPAFIPDNEAEALERIAWHARLARAAHAELADVEAMYAAEMERLRDRLDNRQAIINKRIAWHTAPIESYHRMRLEADPKRKTIELPHGTSRVTVPTKPKAWITDYEAATEWARTAHPEIMRGPNVTDLRDVVQITDDLKVIDPATGEIVPGVAAEIPAARWTFDPEPGSPF